MEKFTQDELVNRAFLRAARMIFEMYEEKESSDTRLLLPPLIPDIFVIVGESIGGGNYREHVIPRAIICDRCHKMFEDNSTLQEVADFIRKHLKIVLINMQEQKLLDHKDAHNLKQSMPPGWTFESGDIYARLICAGIQFTLFAGQA